MNKTNLIIDWQKGTLEWREPKEGKALPKQEKPLRTTVTITEEEDEEEYLNSTQNSLDDTEFSVLISTITSNMDNSEWISSESTMVAKIQAEINVEKEILPLEEQVPKEYLDVFSEE